MVRRTKLEMMRAATEAVDPDPSRDTAMEDMPDILEALLVAACTHHVSAMGWDSPRPDLIPGAVAEFARLIGRITGTLPEGGAA